MITDRPHLILGTVNAPPLHLKQEELEQLYQSSTKPFLTEAYSYPDVGLTLVFSGHYLQWLARYHSEYILALGEMVRRKQIEILGGPFYAPLLPLIPPNDRIGQIEELTTSVRKILGKRPRGCWLPKGVWELPLAATLANCGMEFTFLEEHLFSRAGLNPQHYFQPHVSENQGKLLTVFPYSLAWTDKILAGNFNDLLGFTESLLSEGRTVLTCLLPGDAWGRRGQALTDFYCSSAEPGLQTLFSWLRENQDRIETVHPSVYLKKQPSSLPRIHLSNSTYEDLQREAGLVRDESEAPFRNYRQFLSDYPEINDLYARMLFVHMLAYQIRRDKYRKKAVLEDLWKAQNLYFYFSWSEGGFFENGFRKQAYALLLQAELKARDRLTFIPSLGSVDLDFDGLKEFFYQGQTCNIGIDSKGAQVISLDHLKPAWALGDCLSQAVGGARRKLFADRFPLSLDWDSFSQGLDTDRIELYTREFKTLETDREQKILTFSLRFEVLDAQGVNHPLRLEKSFQIREGSITLRMSLESLSNHPLSLPYALESRFSLPGGDGALLESDGEGSGGGWGQASTLGINDGTGRFLIHMDWNRPARLWVRPLYWGPKNQPAWYQDHRVLLYWNLHLEPGERFDLMVETVIQTKDSTAPAS